MLTSKTSQLIVQSKNLISLIPRLPTRKTSSENHTHTYMVHTYIHTHTHTYTHRYTQHFFEFKKNVYSTENTIIFFYIKKKATKDCLTGVSEIATRD